MSKQGFFRGFLLSKKVVFRTLGLLFVLSVSAQSKSKNDSNSLSGVTAEKIYIHTDRDHYNLNDAIWFKIYLVDGVTHTLDSLSEVVYVELRNAQGQLIDIRAIYCKKGQGHGDFILPLNMENGIYHLKGYTQYMKNFGADQFFEKTIQIGNHNNILDIQSDAIATIATGAKDTLTVQFYPEAGSLLNETLNKVAFSIRNENGIGVTANGKLLDDANKPILDFSSSAHGLGFFEFVPKRNKKYKAVLFEDGVERKLAFPHALDSGIKMAIIEFTDHYRANIKSTGNLEGFTFEGKQRSGTVFTSKIKGQESKIIIKVPKTTLKEGIAQFQLFDQNGQPRLSRKVFYEDLQTLPRIEISSKSICSVGEPISLGLFLAVNDTTTMANVSISVAKEPLLDSTNQKQDIRSYFLINTEVPNGVSKNYFLEPSKIARKENLDVVMMTHLWRNSLDTSLGRRSKTPSKFKPEKGFSLIGTIKDETNQLVSGAKVSLNYKGSNEIGLEEVKTDSLGRFAFGDLVFKDSTLVSLVVSKPPIKERGRGKKNKDMSPYLSIELDSMTKTFIENRRKSRNGVPFLKPGTITDPKNVKSFFVNEDDESRLVVLDEVAISAGKLETENRYRSRRMLYKNPTQTLDFEEVPTLPFSNVLEALVARVPGLTFRGDRIYLRGASSFRIEESEVLILVDGTPMENATVVEQIPVSEVDFIDVLKGPKAAIYGARGANGIIAIYTKIGPGVTKKTEKDLPLGSLTFVHPGFDVTSEFSRKVPKNETESYTLYWNPSFFLNTTNTLLELDAPKDPGTYKIRVEGMSFDGRPISKVEYFEVR